MTDTISTGAPVDGQASPTGSKDITRLSFPTELGKVYYVRWQPGPHVVLVPPGEAQKSMWLTMRQPSAC